MNKSLALAHFQTSFQFITHQNERFSYLEGAYLALIGGCDWVQLRMKGATDEEVEPIARKLKLACEGAGATFILDDRVELVKKLQIDGVHLGKNDMPVDEARKLLGDEFIIGGTANTFDDIRRLHEQGADYIGCGPFRYTTTKEKLSPVLGIEGYRQIIEHPVRTGNMTLSDACSEAIRDWCCHPQDTFYIVGSTMGPHPYPDIVAKMQSVISEELKWQLEEKIGRDYPDYLIACVGGGSNAAGTIYHYIDDDRVKIYLAEAAGHGIDTDYTAATMHCGTEGIIHGARTLVMQTEDGQIEEAFTISAGLDYPGIGPMHADLATSGRSHVLAIKDDEAIYAGYELTRMEGIIPAIESAHAVAALKKMKFKKDDVVVLTVSGRGDKDVETYLSHKEMAGEYGNF